MKTFTDNTGRAWSLAINVDAVKRVKALVNVDLLQAVEGKLIEQLVADPILLCDVVFCLCKPQADQLGVSDEDFGRAMAGDAIEQATSAMLEELVDFFPSRRRALLTKAVGKFRTLQETVLTAAEARLDSGLIEKRLAVELAALDAEITATLSPPPRRNETATVAIQPLLPRRNEAEPVVEPLSPPGERSGNSPASLASPPVR